MVASTFEYPDGPRQGQRGVAMAFALRDGERWTLVDTGIGQGNAEIDDVFRPTGDPLPDLLAGHGVAVDAIERVINSHLHFDHSGQNRHFPGVPILVQEAEWAAAQAPDYTVRGWIDFPGATYRRVAGDKRVAPGIRVVATPGHTPGHQSVVARVNDRVVVLAGQACYSPDEWAASGADIDGADTAWDQAAYARSLDALRALRPDEVWFGHATESWTRAPVG